MTKRFQTFEPCAACGQVEEGGNCFHHLLSRGAYPEFTHAPWNMIPVDHKHHRPEGFHTKGTTWMANNYPGVRKFLEENGWVFDEFLKKWIHPKEHAC